MARHEGNTTTRSDQSGGDSGDEGRLLLVAGEGLLTTFPLLKSEVIIGRAPECDVVVPHPALSRRHARLRLGPPLSVEDLGSKNGTRVARSRLDRGARATLTVGESFHIGHLSFIVVPGSRSLTLSGRQAAEALAVPDPTAEHASPLVREIAASGVNALILGETGVGKEVLAETLHQLSGRKGALVRVNCAALAPSLMESELFGHEKGAFTGAAQSRPGLVEAAAGGTAFLDEVGELPMAVQAKLLRVIESKEVVRVGAVKPISVDVRFIAATNRDLLSDVAEGRFRQDLFFRLDGVTLVIPPLRERRHQIALLALQFLREAHAKQKRSAALELAPDLLQRLEAHDWPGNVRELKAVIERAVLLARGAQIGPKHLALAQSKKAVAPAAVGGESVVGLSADEERERERIMAALEECAGNQTRAARQLGISRATLVTRLGLLRIPRPRKR